MSAVDMSGWDFGFLSPIVWTRADKWAGKTDREGKPRGTFGENVYTSDCGRFVIEQHKVRTLAGRPVFYTMTVDGKRRRFGSDFDTLTDAKDVAASIRNPGPPDAALSTPKPGGE